MKSITADEHPVYQVIVPDSPLVIPAGELSNLEVSLTMAGEKVARV